MATVGYSLSLLQGARRGDPSEASSGLHEPGAMPMVLRDIGAPLKSRRGGHAVDVGIGFGEVAGPDVCLDGCEIGFGKACPVRADPRAVVSKVCGTVLIRFPGRIGQQEASAGFETISSVPEKLELVL